MATHDYNLANQDGASFRSDLNNALSAIVSNNSSSTAPATTFAHQIWVDTTANVVKQRNAANDAWVELWRIDGGFNAKTFSSNVTLNAQSDLRFADSDSSNWVAFQAPATVSSNVTWTLPSADGTADQALTTNGSGVLSWADAGGVQDNITEGNTSAEVVDTGSDGHFKVVTEGTEALRVTAAQRLGIGTTSPGGVLEAGNVGGNVTSGDLLVTTGSTTARVTVGRVSSTSNDNTSFRVRNRLDSTQFQVDTQAITFGPTGTEAARIDSSARLLVGTSSSSGDAATNSQLVVAGSSVNANGAIALTRNSANPTAGQGIGQIFFADSGGGRGVAIQGQSDGTWGSNDYPGRLVFSTTADGASSPTERMRLDSSGNLKFNSGYGSVATAYGVRAWCNADLTGSGSIRASGNVSSLGDQATGRWQFSFTTSMPDANYAAVGMQKPNADIVNMTGLHPTSPSFNTYTTSLVAFIFANASGGLVDPLTANLVVLR